MTMESKTSSSRRRCLETWDTSQKCSLFATIFLAILSFGLLAAFLYVVCLLEERSKSEVCHNKQCAITASTLLLAMDSSVDPCEDFYKFTCADYIRKNPIPEGKMHITTALQYVDSYYLQLKDLLESHYSFQGDPNVVLRAQEFYHVCINATYNEENELREFKGFLNSTFGGWPMAMGSEWKLTNIKLEETLGKLARLRTLQFISTHMIHEKGSKYQLQISMSYLRAPANDDTDKYKNLIRFLHSVIKYLGYSKTVDVSDIQEDLINMEELQDFFEKEKTVILYDPSQTMTIKMLNELTDNKFDWLLYLNTLFNDIHVFDEDEIVNVKNPWEMAIIPKILKKFPTRVIMNIQVYNMILHGILNRASPKIEELYIGYQKAIDQDIERTPRWKECVNWVKTTYPMVIARLFVNKYVDKENKEAADELIQWIKIAYKKRIENSNWLDEETKINALLKVDSIKTFVGYPDFIFDDKKLEKYYKNIPEVKPTYFSNTMELLKITGSSYWMKYNEPVIKKPETLTIDDLIMEIQAFYDPSTNSVWFPFRILQLPFFDQNRLAAVNFGMIGSIIGHEIGHAFDDDGSHYDENGNKVSWWTNNTREMFEKKSKCFVKQYSQYCPEELQGGKNDTPICVNGQYTLGENLADNTGLRAAFEAYRLWTQKHGKEKRLPGLENYSPEQVFFISFGYLWCENIQIDKWLEIYKYDLHSPGSYRNIGTLANNEHFRETFKCSTQTAMNRGSESCTVW